jgi:hypothetical protein
LDVLFACKTVTYYYTMIKMKNSNSEITNSNIDLYIHNCIINVKCIVCDLVMGDGNSKIIFIVIYIHLII